MKRATTLVLGILTLSLASCGNGGGEETYKKPPRDAALPDRPQEQQENLSGPVSGKFKAFIRPMNTRVHGFINSGQAEISVASNFSVTVIMDDAPEVTHIQSIHNGSECPSLEDDKNDDGYIDILEARSSIGEVLLPLAEDLETVELGVLKYPRGSSYTFRRTGDFNRVMKDVETEDRNLEGKVIVIHGASESSNLPPSVETENGLTRAQSIPIACGKMMRVEE